MLGLLGVGKGGGERDLLDDLVPEVWGEGGGVAVYLSEGGYCFFVGRVFQLGQCRFGALFLWGFGSLGGERKGCRPI